MYYSFRSFSKNLQKHLAEEEIRMQGYSNAFGSHLPLKLTMERITTAQSRRLPGLKSSNLGNVILPS